MEAQEFLDNLLQVMNLTYRVDEKQKKAALDEIIHDTNLAKMEYYFKGRREERTGEYPTEEKIKTIIKSRSVEAI